MTSGQSGRDFGPDGAGEAAGGGYWELFSFR